MASDPHPVFEDEPDTSPQACREAFEELEAELEVVPDSDLVADAIDIPLALVIVFGALPRLDALGERLRLSHAPADVTGRLRRCALALIHADAVYRTISKPSAAFLGDMARAIELRSLIFSQVRALVERGEIDEGELEGYSGTASYDAVPTDLLILARALGDHRAWLHLRTAIGREHLAEILALVPELMAELDARDHAELTRRRALTLLDEAYDQARRVVHFVRYHQHDAEQIVPSLHDGLRTGRRRRVSELPAGPGVARPDAWTPS